MKATLSPVSRPGGSSRRALLVSCLAVLGLLSLARTAPAQPAPSRVTGTVSVIDNQRTLLTVNTHLGNKSFRYTATTVYLLNNHTTTLGDLRIGDEVEVTYDYHTSTALQVHIFRELSAKGRILTASASGITLRTADSANLAMRIDTGSRITADGWLFTDYRALADRMATVVYEPNSLLILSAEVEAERTFGRIRTIAAATRALTISGGGVTRTYVVDANATILRDGQTATFANLAVGDQVRFVFARRQKGNVRTFPILAITAQSRPGGAS